jgi:hypothetical protein
VERLPADLAKALYVGELVLARRQVDLSKPGENKSNKD